MKIKRVWLECEDEDGKCYMVPGTFEFLKAHGSESRPEELAMKSLASASDQLKKGG